MCECVRSCEPCESVSTTDEWEEMCLVAVSDSVSRVFQESEFQNLLSALHMQPPSDTVSVISIVVVYCLFLLHCCHHFCVLLYTCTCAMYVCI